MDFVSPILSFPHEYLMEPTILHIEYALHMKTNMEKLKDEMNALAAIEEDVGRKVDVARARLQTPLTLVLSWQSKVQGLKEEVERDNLLWMKLSIHGQCSLNFLSRYKLGKRVAQYLVDGKAYKEEGIGFATGMIVDPNLPSPAETSFTALMEEVNILTSVESDVKSMVEEAKRVHGMLPKHQVEGWLKNISSHKHDVDEIRDEFQNMKEMDDLERNDWVDLSEKMQKVLEKTRALSSEGRCFNNNVADASRSIQVIPQSKILAIGQENAYSRALDLIGNDDVRTIGIYGMGGVGKTTLLKRINNFMEGIGYEIVIFVVVSENGSIEGIQKDIVIRLGMKVENTTHLQREGIIRRCLNDKKFVLLLDDIWKEWDLEEVGVPIHGNNKNYKIIFTTRSRIVCDQMQAKRTKIECLNNEEAWELFKTTVGETILNSTIEINRIGEQVAQECGGLPLALTVIGGAMRSKRTISEWRNALSTLRKSDPQLVGTNAKLYSRLRLSYDSLANDIAQECFSYCALFPEDWMIEPDELVACWICDGFFDECDNLEDARNKGFTVVEDLKLACLLEGVHEGPSLKMHDMVLWIKKDKFMILTRGTNALKKDKWGEIERLSLTETYQLNDLNRNLECTNLSTVLIAGKFINEVGDGFFQNMPNLKVIYIYDSYLGECKSLPTSIWRLAKLRYLNFGRVRTFFPKELGELERLEHWRLRTPVSLSSLEGVIPRLSQLRVLQMWSYLEDLHVKIEDFRSLKHLEDLILTIKTSSYLRELANCPGLAHCVTSLFLNNFNCMRSCSLLREVGSMDWLSALTFILCDSLEEILIEDEEGLSQNCLQNLKSLYIIGCHNFRASYMSRPQMQLQELKVLWGRSVEQLLESSRGGSYPYVFSALQNLYLYNLPRLNSICSNTFSVPHLQSLSVTQCEQLRMLPRGIIQASREHPQVIK